MKTAVVVLSLVALATGCKKGDEAAAPAKADAPKGGATPDAPAKGDGKAEPAAAAAAAPASKYKANAAVVELLKKIIAGCTVSVDSPAVYSCKAQEDRELDKYIRESKPKDLYETYASLLDNADMKLRAAAVAEASNGLFSVEADLLKENATKPIAQAFLDAFAKGDDYASQLAQTTVALAFLAGLKDELIKATDAAKEEPRRRAYTRFVQYGRLDGFPKVQEVAKQKEFTTSALLAPRYMTNWTDEEKAAICPWAKGFLGDADLYVAKEAGETLIECRGEYIDALLDEGEKRLKAKTFDDPFASVFGEVCQKFTFQPEIEKDKQCKRDFVFLEKVVNTATLKADVRAYALWGIFSQRRNKECLPVMKKYKKNKVPEIAARANTALEALAGNGIK